MTVTIEDADRRLEFTLSVVYRHRQVVFPRMGWRNGGDPGEAEAVEIDRAQCRAVVVWLGNIPLVADLGVIREQPLGVRIGDWCLQEYESEIAAAILDQIQSRRA